MRRHSRAAQNKDIARALNTFREHPAAIVSHLGEQLQPAPTGPEYDQCRRPRRAFRARRQAGSKRRRMRDRASPPHPEARLPCVCLGRFIRTGNDFSELVNDGALLINREFGVTDDVDEQDATYLGARSLFERQWTQLTILPLRAVGTLVYIRK